MRWNNNHANTINYRALIRLAFAMAIIAAMLMAILDHHQESSPAISSERITQLNQALRKKLSHDLYARVSVTSSRIVLKRSAAASTDQQLKQQLDQLSTQTNQLQRLSDQSSITMGYRHNSCRVMRIKHVKHHGIGLITVKHQLTA